MRSKQKHIQSGITCTPQPLHYGRGLCCTLPQWGQGVAECTVQYKPDGNVHGNVQRCTVRWPTLYQDCYSCAVPWILASGFDDSHSYASTQPAGAQSCASADPIPHNASCDTLPVNCDRWYICYHSCRVKDGIALDHQNICLPLLHKAKEPGSLYQLHRRTRLGWQTFWMSTVLFERKCLLTALQPSVCWLCILIPAAALIIARISMWVATCYTCSEKACKALDVKTGLTQLCFQNGLQE